MSNLSVRPCISSDLDALEDLAYSSPVGLTSLPEDRERLAQRLANSQASFAREVTEPGAEEYLFALVDEHDQLLGVSGIVARAGSEEPYFNFRCDGLQTYSHSLGEGRRVERLLLSTENTNKSVFSAFYLNPAHNTLAHTEMLARARILYMVLQPQRFCEQVIVEFVGVTDAKAESPFWNAIGKAFFSMEYDEAEHLSATRRKHFIGELIPPHAIFVDLLPPEARVVIGDYDKNFQRILDVAVREGFSKTSCVDIFDAGPCYQIARNQLTSYRQARMTKPDAGEILVAEGRGLDFRCRRDDAAACVLSASQVCVPLGYES